MIFFAALYLLPESARLWIDRVFYVWTSVFALFEWDNLDNARKYATRATALDPHSPADPLLKE